MAAGQDLGAGAEPRVRVWRHLFRLLPIFTASRLSILRLPELPPADPVISGEEQGPVHVGEGRRKRGEFIPWKDVCDLDGAPAGAVALPELQITLLVLGYEVERAIDVGELRGGRHVDSERVRRGWKR